MKRISSSVSYTVPHWDFCNVDKFDLGGGVSKQTCQFCSKTKTGYTCLLYNTPLSSKNDLISKTVRCCEATAGIKADIIADNVSSVPVVPPKELIKQSLELYTKTVNDLINQGYPKTIAETTAKKYVLGD